MKNLKIDKQARPPAERAENEQVVEQDEASSAPESSPEGNLVKGGAYGATVGGVLGGAGGAAAGGLFGLVSGALREDKKKSW